jgi:hypothetical protein
MWERYYVYYRLVQTNLPFFLISLLRKIRNTQVDFNPPPAPLPMSLAKLRLCMQQSIGLQRLLNIGVR